MRDVDVADEAEKSNLGEIQSWRDEHIGRLFLRAHRDFGERASIKLAARGYPHMAPAHLNLLPHIEAAGSRISLVADRAAITKQAAGQLVADLERAGLLLREVDRTDRRAVVVRFSVAGLKFLHDAAEVKHEIEAEYMRLLGDQGFDSIRTLLHRLLADSPQATPTAADPSDGEVS